MMNKTINLVTRRKFIQTLILGTSSLALLLHKNVNAELPKLTKIIVAFPPGTAPDNGARLFAKKMSETTGLNYIVENKPGAGGAVAISYVLNSEPDGSTLLWATSGEIIIAPVINRKLSVDPFRLDPVIELYNGGFALVTSPSLEAESVEDLLAWHKKNQPIFVGTFGLGSPHHLLALLFGANNELDIEFVHYKSGADFASDLRSGRIQFGFASAQQSKIWQDGNLVKIIAAASQEKSPLLPNVLSFGELGQEDSLIPTWNGIFAPDNTPIDIKKQIFSTWNDALHSGEVQDYLKQLGNISKQTTYGSFSNVVQQDKEFYSTLAKKYEIMI